MAKTVTYRDIDLTFQPHPVTGDVGTKTDASAIVQSIQNLVLTSPTEIVFDPEVGGGIEAALFKLNSAVFRYSLQSQITTTINNWEPRCQLESVEIRTSVDRKTIQAIVSFYILNSTTLFTGTLNLIRTR
jgi:phage baseplate assembly protein W